MIQQPEEIHDGRQRPCISTFIAGKGIVPAPDKICGLLLGKFQFFTDSRQVFGFFIVDLFQFATTKAYWGGFADPGQGAQSWCERNS